MDTGKSNKMHWKLSHNSFVAILIASIILLLYVPFSLYFQTMPYRENAVIDGMQVTLTYPVFIGDSVYYATIAQNILHHHIVSGDSVEPLTPATFVMPLYPAFLALCEFLFGSLALVPLLQSILAGLSAFLIFLLGKKFFSEKVGLLSAVLFMLDPTVIFHSLIVMTDIPYVFLLVLAVWLLFASDFKNTYAVSFVSGIVLGLAMLTRTASLGIIFIIVAMYFFGTFFAKRKESFKEIPYKKILLNILLIVFAYCIVLVPWMIRNEKVSGVFAAASEGSVNLFHYYVPDFLSFKENISVDAARNILTANLAAKIGEARAEDYSSLPNASAAESVALQYIKSDPFGYAKFHLIKTIPFFLSSGIKNFFISYNDMVGYHVFDTNDGNMTNLLFHGQFGQFIAQIKIQPWTTLEEIYWTLVVLCILVALLFSKNKFYVISFAVIIAYFALITGPIAYSRFRLPALPFMLLLACEGLYILKHKLFTHRIQ